jgi:hypothetical protein
MFGVGVSVQGKVSDHLLVCEFISFSSLNDAVQNKNVAVVGGFEDQNVLVEGFLDMENLNDLEGHGCHWGLTTKGERHKWVIRFSESDHTTS